jgi:hypothetical protein
MRRVLLFVDAFGVLLSMLFGTLLHFVDVLLWHSNT